MYNPLRNTYILLSTRKAHCNICSRLTVGSYRQYSAVPMARPGLVSFSDYLQNLLHCLENCPEPPLERMASISRERGYTLEPLVNAIISRPQYWLRSDSDDTILEVLRNAMASLSISLCLHLVRTVLSEKSDGALASRICLDALKVRDLRTVLKIADEIHFAQQSLSSCTLNTILRRASRLNDTVGFVKAYRLFRVMNVAPDTATYQILISWHCRHKSVEPIVPRSLEGSFRTSFNLILQGSLEVDGSSVNFNDRDRTISGLLKDGRTDLVWEYMGTVSPSSFPLMEGTINRLCLNIRCTQEFQTLKPWLRTERYLAWVISSPWASSGDTSIAIILEAALELSFLSGGFWDKVLSMSSFDLYIVFARFLTKKQRSVVLRACCSSAKLDDDTMALVVEDNHHLAAHARILGKLFLDSIKGPDIHRSIQILQSFIINGLQLPQRIKVHLQATLIKAIASGLGQNVFQLLKLMIEDSFFKVKGFNINKICQAFYDHGEMHYANQIVQVLAEAKVIPPTGEIFGKMLTTKDMAKVSAFIKSDLQQMALTSSSALSASLQGILYRRAFREGPLLVCKAVKERPDIVKLYHFALALQGACIIRDYPLMMQIKLHMQNSGYKGLISEFRQTIKNLSPPVNVPNTPENRALGMAFLMVVLVETDMNTFFEHFENFFNGSIRPDTEVLRLLLQVVCDEGSLEIREYVAQNFMSWISREKINIDKSIYTKLIRLAGSSKDFSLFQQILSQVIENELTPNYSLFKQFARFFLQWPDGLERLPALMDLSKRHYVKWDSALFEEIIGEAVKRGGLQIATDWIRKALTEGAPPSSLSVQRVLQDTYRNWPMSAHLAILKEFGAAGYYADADIYNEFATEFAKQHDEEQLVQMLDLAWAAESSSGEQLTRRVLSLLLGLGNVQLACGIWNKYCRPRKEQFVDICSFRKLLDMVLLPKLKDTPHLFQALPANRMLQTDGVEETVDLVALTAARLSEEFCQSGLENAIGVLRFDLARKIHRYMFAHEMEICDGVHERVVNMWRIQLDISGQNCVQ